MYAENLAYTLLNRVWMQKKMLTFDRAMIRRYKIFRSSPLRNEIKVDTETENENKQNLAKIILNRTWEKKGSKKITIKRNYRRYINSPLRNEIKVTQLINYDDYIAYKKYLMFR